MNYTEYVDHAITPLVLATELRARREGLLAQLNEVVSINKPGDCHDQEASDISSRAKRGEISLKLFTRIASTHEVGRTTRQGEHLVRDDRVL